jgi:small subunit ribosomal protein S16
MAVKIRLTRIGRHKDPFFRIVAADSRYARDGRYIEQIGYFDPEKGVENAVVDEELALKWLEKGATPSDTVRAVFNRKGILAKHAGAKAPKAKAEKKPAAKKAPAKKTATKKAE